MKKKPKNRGYGTVYPVMKKIKATLDGRLHTLADRLQSATKNFGKRKLAFFFALFLSLYGFCYGYILCYAFREGTGKYTVARISVPIHVSSGDTVFFPGKRSGGNSAERRRITAFKNYMDSLESSGSPRFDSIQKARPGLLDSLRMVEKDYRALP